MNVSMLDQQTLQEYQKKVYDCPTCHGRNLACDCYREYFTKFNAIMARIPVKYRNFTLKDISSSSVKSEVRAVGKYIKNMDHYRKTGTGLYLWGNPGTAKTSLGCIVLIEAIKKRYSAFFTTVEEYKQALFDKNFEFLDKVQTSTYLMIDDIGREFHDAKGFIGSYLDELVRLRTDNLLPILMTSNLDTSEANEERDRFNSIIQEHFLVIDFKHSDYRKTIQDQIHNDFQERKA